VVPKKYTFLFKKKYSCNIIRLTFVIVRFLLYDYSIISTMMMMMMMNRM